MDVSPRNPEIGAGNKLRGITMQRTMLLNVPQRKNGERLPGRSVVKTLTLQQGTGVQSLVEGTKIIHTLWGTAEKERNEWIKKMWHVHTTNTVFSLKGNPVRCCNTGES